ncbi:N-acetylglucosaminyldiphosphodolichol N-acetylglucosaminyltransferase catalytic subunit alg13 [Halocaridina rubra]|uniref:N-acetylglucosaminyldiphosphodolichol N-acetylglucosaminyltransferase catalytic subunit alg13 n=1 Tax=Halocaridina rubra TaxID=373956 RepID=A0AAN9AFA5_HALRR
MRRRLNSRACDPFDEWLDSLGLCRKQVARDGSCLFRAVAEQVFLTQTEHVRVRSLCLQYMLQHKEDFQPFLDMPLDHYVYNLHDMREWGGHLEIMSMSRLFKRNFIIYREIGQEPYKVTDIEGKSLMLSFTHGNHYDIVYKKEDASLRGFCQSVVYDILYSHVFKLTDVRLAVDTMLHDKEYANLRRDSSNSAELKEIGALVEKIIGVNVSRDSQDGDEKNESSEEKVSANDIHPDDVRGLLTHGIPPFSYKVAKALDPDLYRNIEFDTWNTVRREARYGPFDYNGFQAGVKVLIKRDLLPDHLEIEKIKPGNSENGDGKAEQKCSVFHGHIQEMAENKGPVDVYIEELGRRLKVPYESLERVPPTPPRSPWHSHVQPHIHGSGGVPTPPGGGGMPAYKNLSGYYQKAPLPPENEFSVGKGKKKGAKPMRDSLPSAGRYGSSQNSGMRGRSYGSPVGMGHSPRARIPQGYSQNNFHRNSHNRGIGRAREDFPAFFNSSSSAAPGVDGVWAARPSGNQQLASSTPKSNNSSAHYALSPPPLCEDQSKVQVQSVTEALQQVMSAGGQEVRITGQQLEVVNNPDNDFVDEQASARLQGNYGYECDLTSAQGDVEVDKAATAGLTNHTPVAINEAEPVVSHPSEELYAPSPHPDVDPNMIYFSTASGTQIGCPSQNSDMYTVTFPPPYVSSAYVQMVSPATSDGTYTPCEYPTSSTVDQGRPDSVDGMSQSE